MICSSNKLEQTEIIKNGLKLKDYYEGTLDSRSLYFIKRFPKLEESSISVH